MRTLQSGDFLNKDDEDLIHAVKPRKKDSFFNFPLDVIKFDAFIQGLEADQFTGIVEITTKQKILRIFLKKGKTLKCLMDDREVSMFEIEKMKERGTVSLYRIDEKVLSIMVLFSGAEPQEILSTEYTDIKKYLKVKERDHFSGIVEFLEEGPEDFCGWTKVNLKMVSSSVKRGYTFFLRLSQKSWKNPVSSR